MQKARILKRMKAIIGLVTCFATIYRKTSLVSKEINAEVDKSDWRLSGTEGERFHIRITQWLVGDGGHGGSRWEG